MHRFARMRRFARHHRRAGASHFARMRRPSLTPRAAQSGLAALSADTNPAVRRDRRTPMRPARATIPAESRPALATLPKTRTSRALTASRRARRRPEATVTPGLRPGQRVTMAPGSLGKRAVTMSPVTRENQAMAANPETPEGQAAARSHRARARQAMVPNPGTQKPAAMNLATANLAALAAWAAAQTAASYPGAGRRPATHSHPPRPPAARLSLQASHGQRCAAPCMPAAQMTVAEPARTEAAAAAASALDSAAQVPVAAPASHAGTPTAARGCQETDRRKAAENRAAENRAAAAGRQRTAVRGPGDHSQTTVAVNGPALAARMTAARLAAAAGRMTAGELGVLHGQRTAAADTARGRRQAAAPWSALADLPADYDQAG